jgi:hypothetical protein
LRNAKRHSYSLFLLFLTFLLFLFIFSLFLSFSRSLGRWIIGACLATWRRFSSTIFLFFFFVFSTLFSFLFTFFLVFWSRSISMFFLISHLIFIRGKIIIFIKNKLG